MDTKYLTTAETAKLIRTALKKAFPGVKFGVRSSEYSMGSSVRVAWTDGPTTKQVEGVAKQYGSSGFDGMIDMKYNYTSWLLPDGTAIIAENHGTQGSGGVYGPESNPQPHPDAILVSFGPDYVFCNRSYSESAIAPYGNEGTAWRALQEVSL